MPREFPCSISLNGTVWWIAHGRTGNFCWQRFDRRLNLSRVSVRYTDEACYWAWISREIEPAATPSHPNGMSLIVWNRRYSTVVYSCWVACRAAWPASGDDVQISPPYVLEEEHIHFIACTLADSIRAVMSDLPAG